MTDLGRRSKFVSQGDIEAALSRISDAPGKNSTLQASQVREILEAIPIGISIVTCDGKTRLFTNRQHQQNFGYADAAAARSDLHANTWVNVGDFDWAMAEFKRQGKVGRFESERMRIDGTVWWCMAEWCPIVYGGADAIVIISDDISARKAAEEALKLQDARLLDKNRELLELNSALDASARKIAQREAQFLDMLEMSPIGISVITRDTGMRLFHNRRLGKLFGYADNVYIKDHANTWVDFSDFKAMQEQFRRDGFVEEFEHERLRVDGTPWWCMADWRPIVFEGQDAIAIWHYDITVRKEAEAALKASESKLAQIIDGCPVPMFVIDDEHRITHWNRACEQIVGTPASAMIGTANHWQCFYDSPRPVMADIVISSKEESEAALARYYAGKHRSSPLIAGAYEAEGFFSQVGESGRWIYFMAAPLHDANGKFIGAIETLQDITERRNAEDLIQNQTSELRLAYGEMEARVAARTAELSLQLHFVRQLIEAIPGPVFYKDANARYLGFNRAFEEYIGRPASELVGKTPHEVESGVLADHYLAIDLELLEQGGSRIYESQVRFAKGEMRDVMFYKAAFTLPDGAVGGLVGVMLDITERKRMEDDLRQAATVFESSAEGVMITKLDGTIIAINRAFTQITGYDESEVLGHTPRLMQSGRHGKDFYRALWGCVMRDGRWQGEVWNRRKNGEIYPEWLSITTVRDNEGRNVNYVATFLDITVQKQHEERIEQLAFSDPLTQLPNRRLFMDRLQHALATSEHNKCHGAVFFIDLDYFKDLNDTRGHDVGDLLLQQVAERLVECVREADTVARLGGDEFVVMLEDLHENKFEASKQAKSVGEKVLTRLNQPYLLGEHQQHSTPSIGITLFGRGDISVDQLLKQADLAMYQAKGSGRNTLRFFDPEMQKAVSARVAMEADLRQGLRENQFILHYQPQINDFGLVIGAEALVRWIHPQRGLVSPADFIPLAEETELIVPLGNWVLVTACQQLAVWAKHPATANLTLAVNVSAQQFRQQDFIYQVFTAIKDHGVNPERLKLEITESMLLNQIDQMIAKMAAIKARGVSFSLDDFGTGYSSLTYLKRLPIDQLKIDQSFVRGLPVDSSDVAIAQTIVALAHTLKLGVIAEGVETEEQQLFLANIGCHDYQGYFFSRPLPIDKFTEFLESRLS